ncbi:unnamed protein product [Rotaria sp. Silwood2]|nr:unnamed protein product [Rotaria sp. Silwood2]
MGNKQLLLKLTEVNGANSRCAGKSPKGTLQAIGIHQINVNDQLKACEYPTQITKICRKLVEFVYSNVNRRVTMNISSILNAQLEAIHEYAWLVHANQSQTSISPVNKRNRQCFLS